MRKILSSLLYIGIMAFYLQSCSSTTPDKDGSTDQHTGKPTNDQDQSAFKDVGIIDRNDARMLVREYRENYGTVHTKAAWFDTAVIRLLYDSLCKTPGRFDGVRVYLGVYPPGFPDIQREKENKLTVFFVPTMPDRARNISIDTFIYKKEHIKGLNHGELCPNYCDTLGNLHLGM